MLTQGGGIILARPCLAADLVSVKEAHMHRMVSEAEDCNTSCSQIQVDDMACQLEPGGFVISCTREDY